MAHRKIKLPLTWSLAGQSALRRLVIIALACAGIAAGGAAQAASWSLDQAYALRQAIVEAPLDALPYLDVGEFDAALSAGASPRLDELATGLALDLARLHLLGSARSVQKTGWNIPDSDRDIDIAALLEDALRRDRVKAFFAGLRPAHPDYAALRAAYHIETDPARRTALARNMERWRWLPRDLGKDYVIVNIPQFEARLWRGGRQAGMWPVIVGRTSTPTPVFMAQITGINFNPWWNIPASIVRRNGGRFPAGQGYVFANGRWRQRPGPQNALGQMKVEMANPYNVIMHDTPGRDLFAREKRAFSNGCVRTSDAIGFAATLLEGVKTRAEVDEVVASRRTVTFNLARPLPVYLTYFTAAPDADGAVIYPDDLYRRDGAIGDLQIGMARAPTIECRA
ncbi:MAG: L,D-transpeptidase family protein [Erythrobacter sp.]